MGSKYQAEQRVEHKAIACSPDMIKPTPKDPPLPFITYVEFDSAVNVAGTAQGNQHPAFVSVSKVPHCKGGPPGGKGIKSGTWNGEFVPTDWSKTVQTGPGWQVYHGDKGTINNGNTNAEVLTFVAAGAPSSPCIASLKAQFERTKRKANAEFSTDPWQFSKDMGSGAWDNIKGYGDTASSLWDGVKTVAGAVWNDPLGSASKAADAIGGAAKSVVETGKQVAGLGKALIDKDLSIDDMLNGLEDLVSEVGEEAACALAKMLQETADAPGGVGKSVGGMACEAAIQIGLAMATGGSGNAAAATADAAKAGKYGSEGLGVLAKAGSKLKAMGIEEGDDLKTVFRKLKERRAGKGNSPDKSPHKPDHNPEPPGGGNKNETHNKGQGKGDADKPCPVCPTVGGPVNPIQGCKVLSGDEDLDFVLPGLMPLHWQRSYASNNPGVAWYGQGWSVPFTLALHVKDGGEAINFIDGFGRVIAFPGVAPGREFFSASEGISLRRDGAMAYSIVGSEGSRLVFDQPAGAYLMCGALEDVQGRAHRIYYRPSTKPGQLPEPRHLLAQGGQVLSLVFADRGQHQGQPARRLVEVRQLGDASGGPQNPLQSRLAELPTFDERWQRLHEVLTADQLPTTRTGLLLVRYSYSAEGDLETVSVPDADDNLPPTPKRRFAWQQHLMIRHELAGGWTNHYAYDRYDAQGKVQQHWQTIAQPGDQPQPSARRDWQFVYAGGSTRVVQAAGTPDERAETYHFDDKLRWTGSTDALGQRTTFVLNEQGHTQAVIDPAGRTTRYVLDGKGRPTQVINANGERSSIVWHATLERPLMVTNALGGSERYELDAFGNLLSSADALGRRTHYVLDGRGLPTEIHDAKGGIKRLDYDDWGQITRYTDCSGRSTELRYDAWGQLSDSVNALGQRTRYRHDRNGRLQHVQHPDGTEERFGYDEQGRLIAHTDAAGHVTRWELAADGLPLRRVNAMGQPLSYRYDAHRRLAQLINENSDRYAFTYDALDRLIGEETFDGKRSRYRYDAAGQLTQSLELGDAGASDADLIETRFERDPVGRLLAKLLKTPGRALVATRFAYDANGALVRASNVHCRVTLRYDDAGQLIEEQLTAAGLVPPVLQIPRQGGGRQHTLKHRYDELGNRVATTLPDGRVLNTLVYGSGYVHQFNIDGQIVSDIDRDELHRESARSQGQLRSQRQYDAMGRLTSQQVQRDPGTGRGGPNLRAGLGDGAVIQRSYQYDAAGQLSRMHDWRRSVQYGYDPLGQLLSANEERFAFDPAHNLLPGNAQGLGSVGRVERNRLLVFEDQRFSYDGHGRMASKHIGAHTQLQLDWNAEHQLERSVLQRRGQAAVDTGYAYDPFGRRLYKAPLDAEDQPIAKDTTWFVWDGNRLLQELKVVATDGDKPTKSLTQTYVYEPESFVPLAQLRAVDDLAVSGSAPERPSRVRVGKATAEPTKSYSQAELRYFHCDQIGTPRELTATDGRIAWQASYKAWGSTASVQWEALHPPLDGAVNAPQWQESSFDHSSLQPLRFQGQYFDVETGLHYNRFRYYDPTCGKYATSDPIGLLGGINGFQYAANAQEFADPLGLNSTTLNKALGGRKGDCHQAHHLIPEEVMNDPAYKGMFNKLKTMGFNPDGAGNGVLLPDSEGLARATGVPGHWSNHDQYTAGVRGQVDSIYQQWARGRLSDTQLVLGMKEVQLRNREAILSGKVRISSKCRLQ